ncbi:DUF4123 domain-containing protein [Vibrio sp.]|nr:DUF4123 domain-containing protein [Vibrio sp.]
MSDTQLEPEWRVSKVDIHTLSVNEDSYAIVEPQLWDKWKFWLYKYVPDPKFAFLFKETAYSHIENGPVVMKLSGSLELFNECVSQMEKTPCGCLVAAKTGQDWNSILTNLRNAIAVSNERTEVLLRYYEPRTLLPLLASMSHKERFAHFSSLEQFIWYHKAWLLADIPSLSNDESSVTSWILINSQLEYMQTILKQW